MEQATEISAVKSEEKYFDAVEIAGLVVPLLFAIMAIVMASMNPNPSGAVSKDSEKPSERLEQIQQRSL